MKKVSLLLVIGLLYISLSSLAGEVITNDTGENATGLRVVFSTPVFITAFGDILTNVDQEGLSYEFLFSGGTVEAWGSHWLNWSPATAQIISYEWLNRVLGNPTLLADDVTIVAHWRNDVFEFVLPEDAGGATVGTITRTLSVEQIPFVVEYEIELLREQVNVTWTSRQTDIEEKPVITEGSTARFVYASNRTYPVVSARFEIDGQEYQWTDRDILFPLHNMTEIALDASSFFPDDDVISAEWSAANGDPDDAVTFPIDVPTASVTTLVSEWPNVLTIACDITRHDGSTDSEAVEALIYFRDGTPFEIRSIASTIHNPILVEELDEVLGQEFPHLEYLGANTITTSINWYFGPPDENGNWRIHPIWQDRFWPWDKRGNTILMEDFEELVTRAEEAGFRVHVQFTAKPYENDAQLHQDYWGKYFPLKITDAFLFGAGTGLKNMLLFYVEEFIRHGIDTVFLAVEDTHVERFGGQPTQEFFRSVIERYRQEGFTGSLSYAHNYAGKFEWDPELLQPGVCGIPFYEMDSVAATYYPIVADHSDASTLKMQTAVREDIETFFKPYSDIYGKPLIIEDAYCFGYVNCATTPIDHAGERGTECSRRYFNAILREFSAAAISSTEPWIKGMTIGEYKISPDHLVVDFNRDGNVAYPWLNEAAQRVLLQLAIKVFYSDKPLLAIDQNGIEPRAAKLEKAEFADVIAGGLVEDLDSLECFEMVDDFERPQVQPPARRWFDDLDWEGLGSDLIF